jgi:ferredoxin
VKKPSQPAQTQRPELQPYKDVERVLVQLPPELCIRCPACGAGARAGFRHLGSPRGQDRKECRGCGARFVMSADGQKMRRVG